MQDEERARIRELFGRFATGVTVIAARHGPLLAGMTANAIASISVDPPLLMASVSRRAETHRAIIGSHAFAVSVLASDQQELAECFAQPLTAAKLTRFCDAAWHEAETGSPILEGALAYYDCRLNVHHDGGDHAIFLGDVVAAGYREDASPLLWYGSAYHRLGE
ncbi:MAG TPA: flavin reductase family protein [Candidatus Limnocylindria bacterium]|jgi:flavin reductase (DIM6/NTAB) family NADH-FMN oxidoreductase RutF